MADPKARDAGTEQHACHDQRDNADRDPEIGLLWRRIRFPDRFLHVELAIAHRGPRWRGKLGKFWLYDQAIAFAGHGLDVDRLIAGISEGLAKLVHRGVDVGVVIDVRLVGPKPQTELFPSKNVALLFDEREQHLVNLPLKAKARAAFGYFLALLVDLKRAEPDITRRELDRPGRSCGRIGFHRRTQV